MESSLQRTIEQVEKTSRNIEEFKTDIQSMMKPTRTHKGTFTKMHRNIETKIRRHIISQFSFKEVNVANSDLQTHETDILLLSEDGKRLVIGEVKHELVKHAFGQVRLRMEVFDELKETGQLPLQLKGVTTVIPLVGAEIISEFMRDNTMKKDFVLVEPTNNGFTVSHGIEKL